MLAATALAAWPAEAQESSAPPGSRAAVPATRAAAEPGLALPGLPATATRPDVRVGGFLVAPFADGVFIPPGPAGATRAYDIAPSLTFGVFATDNARFVAGNRRSEVALSVSPGLAVRADSLRARGAFTLTPSFTYYVNETQPNRVTTNFFGSGTVELIPGRFFVDLRGAAFLQPVLAGATPGGVLPGSRSPALQQNYLFGISPYYVQRFGSLATGIVGYQLQYSAVGGSTLLLRPDGTSFRNSPGETVGHSAYAALRTGEDFGRLGMEARVNATYFDGGGPVNDGARNILAAFDARYALTRTLFVLGEIGWQDVRYGGVPGFRYEGIIWGGGVRWDPSPNSTLTAVLRSRAGFLSPLLDARVALGPRTVLFGRYAEEVGNVLAQNATLLNTLALDADGNPVSAVTGAPLPQLGGVGFLATTGGVSRSRIGVASVTRFLQRGSVSVQYFYSQRIPVSAAPGQQPFAQVNNTVSTTLQRELTPVTGGFASVGYSWSRSTILNLPSEAVFASAGLRHRLTERVFANLVYQFSHRTQGSINPFGTTLSSDATQNTVIGTLSMRF